jgi:MoxR-like ATPase
MEKKSNLKQQLLNEMARPKKTQENDDMSKQEDIQEFVPSTVGMEQTIELFENIFDSMDNNQAFDQYHGILLSGEPGTGKTQRITLFSRLLGIELIVIEAPHIVEEHIINIPFIVFDGLSDNKKGGNTQLTGDEYKVELADSNLYSLIKHARKIPDSEYLSAIYRSGKDIIELFEYFGGNETTIPDEFKEVRNSYNVILFLDEFFRQTSMRIRNMLRGILNGKIGAHTIPKNTYIVYATNLGDQGVDEIPTNTQFEHVEMEAPKKGEWFSWLVYKFEKDEHIKLKPQIINKFHHILEDEDISHEDIESEVRTSPRRWEQLLLYINEALPVKDEKDAKNLLSNVKLNFRNYLSGSHSELVNKVLKATAELIKQTSNIEVSHSAVNDITEWKDTLKHQIEMREKLGSKYRTYVPVIAGPPGIGKTAQATSIAKKMNLRFIDIDVSTINAEDVVGLPIPKKDGSGKIETSFSIPSLYQQILEKIHEEDKVYFYTLKQDNPDDYQEKIEEYKKRKVKYLIFFDELNRNSPKVFNAIRRVLLEKNFGPSSEHGELLKLPEEAMMIAAINPHDVGAQELTKHMRDVLDIVDAGADWNATMEYLKDKKVPKTEDITQEISLDIIKKFANKFQSKQHTIPLKERPFHIDLGTDVWISPREYTMFYYGLSKSLQRAINSIRRKQLDNLSAKELAKVEDGVRDKIFKNFKRNLSFIFVKHGGLESDEFMNDLKAWIMNSSDIDIGENIFYKKAVNTRSSSLMDIVEEHFDAAATTSAAENSDFINFINNVDLSKFREDLTDLIMHKIVDQESADKYILKDDYNVKILKDDKIVADPSSKVSLLENFMREIVFALWINQFSNEKINAVYISINAGMKSFRQQMKEKMDPELLGEITNKFAGIAEVIVGIVEDELK